MIVIFRGDLVHTGAAYDACNLSLHLGIDSPRAPHQRDAKATYAADAKGGANKIALAHLLMKWVMRTLENGV